MTRLSTFFALASFAPVCLFGSGCYSTYMVPKSELVHLDGYDIQDTRTLSTTSRGAAQATGSTSGISKEPHRVLTIEGMPVDYSSSVDLQLAIGLYGPSQKKEGGKFSAVHVTDDAFVGTLLDGRTLTEDLSNVNHAEVTLHDSAKTAGLIMGVSAGALAGLIATGFIIAGATSSSR